MKNDRRKCSASFVRGDAAFLAPSDPNEMDIGVKFLSSFFGMREIGVLVAGKGDAAGLEMSSRGGDPVAALVCSGGAFCTTEGLNITFPAF